MHGNLLSKLTNIPLCVVYVIFKKETAVSQLENCNFRVYGGDRPKCNAILLGVWVVTNGVGSVKKSAKCDNIHTPRDS